MSKEKVFIYEIDDDEINVREVTEARSFTFHGLLQIGNRITESFFIADNAKKFEEELYDLACTYFEHWEKEFFFDSLWEHWEACGQVSTATIKGLN